MDCAVSVASTSYFLGVLYRNFAAFGFLYKIHINIVRHARIKKDGG
jgi:hypothetical protein